VAKGAEKRRRGIKIGAAKNAKKHAKCRSAALIIEAGKRFFGAAHFPAAWDRTLLHVITCG
jgi:hypothetical protein